MMKHYYIANNTNEIKHKFDEIKIYETEEIDKTKDTSLKTIFRDFFYKNFKITFSSVSLIKRKFFQFDPREVFKNNVPRYAWTFNNQMEDFNINQINYGIYRAENNMKLIYELLNSKNIKFSVAVYPLPAQLLYDKVDNRQVEVWRKFCEGKCYKFYDFNKILFEKKNKVNEKFFFKEYFITYDEHFNYNGNKLLADEFIRIY